VIGGGLRDNQETSRFLSKLQARLYSKNTLAIYSNFLAIQNQERKGCSKVPAMRPSTDA